MFRKDTKRRAACIFQALLLLILSVASILPSQVSGAAAGMMYSAPPAIDLVKASSSTTLQVTFTVPVDKASAETVSNYECDHNIGEPAYAVLSQDGKTVSLTWSTPFGRNKVYSVIISGVEDLNHNQCKTTKKSFVSTFNPLAGDAPPKVTAVKVLDPMTLQVIFDKEVDKASSQNTLNYFIQRERHPYLASLGSDNKTVTLIIPVLPNGGNYYLSIRDIKDLENSMLVVSANQFTYPDVEKLDASALIKFYAAVKPQLLEERKKVEEQYANMKDSGDVSLAKPILLKLNLLDVQLLYITSAEDPKQSDSVKEKLDSLDASIEAIPACYFVMKGTEAKLDTLAVIKSENIMVPAKSFCNAYGITTSWDYTSGKLTINKGTDVIEIQKNNSGAAVNGKGVAMSINAQFINNQLYVPLKFMAEQFGLKYKYDADLNCLLIE